MKNVLHLTPGRSLRPGLEELDLQDLRELAKEVGAECIRRSVVIDENYESALREDLFALDNRQRTAAAQTRVVEDAERKGTMWLMRAQELQSAYPADRAAMDKRLTDWQVEAEKLWESTFRDDVRYQEWKAQKKKAALAGRPPPIAINPMAGSWDLD